ncbi:MAG: RdgB/HAM1 family non-canonical purine NTP pyrophosphatase [Planctomycetota bacterium]
MSAKRRLVIGTNNQKKLIEMRTLLDDEIFEVLPLTEACPGIESPEEDGETFEDNARLKALYFANASGVLCVADDSGLEVDALDGKPGVKSARWAGVDGDDDLNNARLIEQLSGVKTQERGAQYRCVIAVATPGEVHVVVDGSCRGRILESPQGDGGFGYDPYFFFEDFGKTFAEITPKEKASVSHRGQALSKLREKLPCLLSILENRSGQ